MNKLKLIPVGAIVTSFAIGGVVFGLDHKAPVKLQTVSTEQTAPADTASSEAQAADSATPATGTTSTSGTDGEASGTSSGVVNSTSQPAASTAPRGVPTSQPNTTGTVTPETPVTPPRSVVRSHMDYVDVGNNTQNGVCTWTFSDGSTESRVIGSRPAPGPGIFGYSIDCPVYK